MEDNSDVAERKVQRVLDAARAWRNRQFHSLEMGDLADALDALDAPRERYAVRQWDSAYAVWDCDTEELIAKGLRIDHAAMLAAALERVK